MNNGADSAVKRNAILTATEALTLLASGKPETWDQYTRWELAFMERWRFAPPAAEELRLLEARGAPEPFYPWHPCMSPDGSDVWSYETEYAAPSRWIEGPYGRFKMGAPELARAIRAQHRRRLGCTISFTELAAMLRSELVEHRDRAVRWDRANTRLREAIVNKEAIAWAVRADDPKQEHVALPSQVAFRAIQFRADEIEPDELASGKDFTALRVGSRWTQVRFYTVEIEALRTKDAALHLPDVLDVDQPVLTDFPTPTASAATAGAERRLQGWLEEQMRAAPNESPGKEVMKVRAALAKHTYSSRGFTRAWDNAVRVTDSSAVWSKAGPKSKRANRNGK